jgi:uncharacterized protein YodC (DUF2158 family)
MTAKSKSKTRPLTVGDRVRLKAGGPQGKIVRTSPGGKFRVAWELRYFSNHSAARLRLDEGVKNESRVSRNGSIRLD